MDELCFWDANAFLGPHSNPFAPSPFGVEETLHTMDDTGVNAMMLYHVVGFAYSPSAGNRMLAEILPQQTRLLGCFIAAPEMLDSELALNELLADFEEHGFAAVRVFCRRHHFFLANGSLDALFAVMSERQLPLIVEQPEISWDDLLYVLRRFPRLPVILAAVGYRLGRIIEPLLRQYPHLHLELSRYHVHRGLEYLLSQFGDERFLFGSGLPLFSPQPIMLMIRCARIPDAAKQRIASGNLRRILNRETP